jgi:ABC-2 type transport system permease protein
MWNDIWFLAKKDAAIMLKQRETLAWTFIMPIVFFYFIGTITGGMSGGEARPLPVIEVSGDSGFAAQHLKSRLEEVGYAVTLAELASADGRRVLLPFGFSASVAGAEPVVVTYRADQGSSTSQLDEMRVQRAVYAVLGDIVAIAANGSEVNETSLRDIEQAAPVFAVVPEVAGERREIPSGFEQSVPGITVMFVLMIMFTTGGASLLVERNSGLLRRLASSPMSPASVAIGKWGARMLLGIVQVSFAMLTGWLLFGIDWGGPNIWAVAVLLLVYAGLCAALGILLGNFARTQGQVIGLGVLLTNLMAALGGCWWPIEITPAWAQTLSMAFPTGWAMDGLHRLISFQMSPLSVVPHIAVMLAAGAVSALVLRRKFRFQ